MTVAPAAGRHHFSYATNRNEPSPEGDTVAIFSLDNRTAPALVAEVHTGLRHLRGAAIGGRGCALDDVGWHVWGGGGVVVLRCMSASTVGRSIKEIAALSDIEGPTGFLWIRPPHVGI